MSGTVIDPRKLLGFRVLIAEAAVNGCDLDLSDLQRGKTLSGKVGAKPGIKPASPR